MKDSSVGKAIIVLMVVCGVPLLVMSTMAIQNTTIYHQCTITKQDPNGPTGGHIYDVSCVGGVNLTNIAGGTTFACARVGDSVTVATYGGWWADQITGDSDC
jgi:hypothetical protein